ncbi:MAG: diadenylate cyclase CdaA [Armatimonadetes bacterium]|nr:diadenylate cyclase CdaA [Armatimonadota bacterium]
MIERLAGIFDFETRGIIPIIDILLVAYLVYRLLKLVRGTRAWRVLLGIGVFVIALTLSEKLGFKTLHWILDKATVLAPVALVILLLPELRQAIEGFAKVGLWSGRLIGGEASLEEQTLDEVVKASGELAETNTGALIVLERGNRLDDVASSGVMVHANVKAQLLGAIFYEGNPLHDGAVLIRDGEVLAASCRLPMSESTAIAEKYHMRHRAGIGASEQSDAVVIIISEERGNVALAIDGKLEIMSDQAQLRTRLGEEFSAEKRQGNRKFLGISRKDADKEEVAP